MKTEECIKIYKAAFGYSEPFDSLLFENFADCIECLELDGKTVSMLFKLPCTLNFDGQSIKLYYIYAAATDAHYRGRGYMSALINRVCGCSDAPLFLKPASNELEKFYEKLFFNKITGTAGGSAAFITVPKKIEQLSDLCDSCPPKFILMYRGILPPEIKEFSFPYTMG